MIVFLGDSFTWGQGLQIPYWLKQGKSVEEINKRVPPSHPAELYDYEGDEYRKKHHFPNLVAKHFNTSYCTKWGNGGSNSQIEFLMEEAGRLMDTDGIEAFVVQFTEVSRDGELIGKFYNGPIQRPYSKNLESSDLDDKFPKKYIEHFLENFNNRVKANYDNVKWFGFSWHSDIGEVLENQYPDNYIPINYKGLIHNNFQYLRMNYSELVLAGMEKTFIDKDNNKYQKRIGITDGHLNEKGHQVIADSIIKKINLYL